MSTCQLQLPMDARYRISRTEATGTDQVLPHTCDVRLRNLTLRKVEEELHKRHLHTNRVFIGLMLAQFCLAILFAVTVAPHIWSQSSRQIPLHLLGAIELQAWISLIPLVLIVTRPGSWLTRLSVTLGQTLTSSIIVHLSGGHPEAHFHIFASLVFISFYRDSRLLVLATIVSLADHVIRDYYWPASLYGSVLVGPTEWMQHAGWMLFLDLLLIVSIRWSHSNSWEAAERQAQQELVNEAVLIENTYRTAQLEASEAQARSVLDATADPILSVREDGTILSANRVGISVLGFNPEDDDHHNIKAQIAEFDWDDLIHSDTLPLRGVSTICGITGTCIPVEYCITDVSLISDSRMFTVALRDISEHVRAEAEKTKLQRQLLGAARQAGKAEIANGVLHNVGNVLNTIATSQTVISDMLSKSRLGRLQDLSQMLNEHTEELGTFLTDDPKGKQIPTFINRLAKNLDEERRQLKDEVSSIAKSIEHIKVVIGMQQSLAKAGGLREPTNPALVIEDAIAFNITRIERHGITIERNFENVPDILMDRHQLLQVLINFIKNGVEILSDHPQPDRRISVTVTETNDDYVRITVADNGPGIPADQLEHIFTQGFTTKQDGHGFGLHFSACAVKEMGGRIHVESDGPGQGARFHVDLPIHSAGVQS